VKVELHCHTSRYSACAVASPREMLAAYAAAGFGAVYLTEHDAVWSAAELDELRAAWPKLQVFGGLEREIRNRNCQHVLVLGTSDSAYLSIGDEAELIARARAEGHLTVLAHPCRWPGADAMLDAGILPDALEARSGNQDAEMGRLSERTAARLGLRAVNAADAHRTEAAGTFWIETDRPMRLADDIRQIVLAGAYRNCLAEGR